MAMDSAKLVRAARKHRSDALVQLLHGFDPMVSRLSLALCGDRRRGRKSARRVLRQSLNAVETFRDIDDAQRWFWHHTILVSRHHLGRITADPLLLADTRTDDWFAAFVKSLRHLPVQQREAIVLHYGEHLNERYLGVAMDCSTEAAAMHLAAARKELADLAGHQWSELQQRFAEVYKQLAQPVPEVRAEIRRRVAWHVWPRRIGRLLFVLMVLAVAWGVWSIRHWIADILK